MDPALSQPQQILHSNSQNILGALVTDPSGLCLGHKGSIDPEMAGVFSAIAKMAGHLDGGGADSREAPTIIIQTEKSMMLIKEYHGERMVVFRVPAREHS